MNAAELFSANLRLIDGIARSVCRRRRLSPADDEDFVSAARLALIENDYAVLRRYEGRSSLASFLAVVFDHMITDDQRVHALGRWHPSRAAERMGATGVLLETLLRRERRSIEEALPLVRVIDPALTHADVVAMAARLRDRIPRPRAVPLDPEVEINASSSETGDTHTVMREALSVAARTGEVIRATIASFDAEDRMLVRLHFGSNVSVADVARMLRLPARPLYRRLEARLRDLRQALDRSGLDSRSIIELIGAATTEMNFGLETAENMENDAIRPSPESEAAPAKDQWS